MMQSAGGKYMSFGDSQTLGSATLGTLRCLYSLGSSSNKAKWEEQMKYYM